MSLANDYFRNGKAKGNIMTMGQKAKSLTDQLRQFIETAEVSRYRLSKQTGISQSLLSRFMHGTAGLSVDSLDTLADALDLELTKKKPTRK